MNNKTRYFISLLISVSFLISFSSVNAQGFFGKDTLFDVDANTVALWHFNEISVARNNGKCGGINK